MNLIAFAMYGIDKRKAIKGRYRISEMALLTVAILGGSIGAWLGMQTFRHKTKHLKFKIGVPLIFVIQMALVIIGFVMLK